MSISSASKGVIWAKPDQKSRAGKRARLFWFGPGFAQITPFEADEMDKWGSALIIGMKKRHDSATKQAHNDCNPRSRCGIEVSPSFMGKPQLLRATALFGARPVWSLFVQASSVNWFHRSIVGQ